MIEPDPSYAFSATPAANGGVRQLFSLPENILMAQYGLGFFAGGLPDWDQPAGFTLEP